MTAVIILIPSADSVNPLETSLKRKSIWLLLWHSFRNITKYLFVCVLNPNFLWVLQSYDGFYIVNKHWKLWKRFRFRFLYEHDWRGLIYHSQSSDCLSYKNKLIYNNLHGRTSLCLNGLCPRTTWTGLSMIHFSSVVQTAVIMNNYISLLFFLT